MRGYSMRDVGWTPCERRKAVYVAKRAIRLGLDPLAEVKSYIGMSDHDAELAVRMARSECARTHWEGRFIAASERGAA